MAVKNRVKTVIGGFLCLSVLFGGRGTLCAWAGLEGSWDRSEDGKHWQYVYSPGEPVCSQWIVSEGNDYYLDNNGNIKTGWFTDPADGSRYYLGEDGALRKNTFLPDGSYAGEDGRILKAFGVWRKAMDTQLTKLIRSGTEGVFALADLNGDGYRDLAVLESGGGSSHVFLTAVWDEEEETLCLGAESANDEEEQSHLAYNSRSQSVWLITESGDGRQKDYFTLEDNGAYFEQIRHFETDTDDWGGTLYYVDGDETDQGEWEQLQEDARSMSGEDQGDFFTAMGISATPLDADSVAKALDQAPSGEELALWQP